ncbi:MAG: TIM barrel protein [Ruminiclostridium sp.]
MLKLMNFSNHSSDLEWFSSDYNQIKQFLKKHDLQGLEMIQTTQWNAGIIPASMISGLHMRFWPIWLDFWRNDKAELLRQFGDVASYTHYYGGESRNSIMEYYRNEIKTACDMDTEYIVFHVSHVQLEHCYNYRFTYNDDEVIEAFIEMINELLEGVPANFELLLENQWWPGLTFLDKKAAARLMDGIRYPNKGFMLDIGHLMNTNTELATEAEAVTYILEVLEELEELSVYIRGIHLNSSLSGEYVKKQLQRGTDYNPKESFFNRYLNAFGHISRIDRHVPYTHPSIKRVIDFVNPQYLVYEFITDSFKKLEQYVETQNQALGY